MISNKTAVTQFFLVLVMKTVASTSSSNPQGPSSPGMPALQVRKRKPALGRNKILLRDRENAVSDVELREGSNGAMDIRQEQSIPQVNNEFEELINKGGYMEICVLVENMEPDVFSKQFCSAVKTLEQYKKIVDCLKSHKLVASFYIYGDIGVVKGAVVESKVYDKQFHAKDGDLETALHLALKGDNYDRVVELLRARKGVTAKNEEQDKQSGELTSFETCVSQFLYDFASEGGGMALKRFLTLCGDELREKHPDILDNLCEHFLSHLSYQFDEPKAEKLLIDFIGQPSLLTPIPFAKGFLCYDDDELRSAFIKYGWHEAIQEVLKKEYPSGGEKLWQMIMERPTQIVGEYPPSNEVLNAVLECFPTKQQKEEQWAERNAIVLFNKIKRLESLFHLLPNVLWSIITNYAISWTDVDDLIISEE